ncbi:hypothetical protein BDV96DRAFT_567433 [Lophiotrema nucula]|uniref:Protein kinase domain-containing protein n=1 Tax=Lophiotrema nucula TaxID=690887 RepID=A0A6A5ZIL9_9PLEO|nr:hypothetical protein BDV96DRAFT_567433 [Lophiotrema nucula]
MPDESVNLALSSSSSSSSESEDEFDPDLKPLLPYVPGYHFTAKQHDAEGPFGNKYQNECPPEIQGWKRLSQTQYCLRHAFPGGTTYNDVTLSSKIISRVRTGYDCGAQLVVVKAKLEGQTPVKLVAKIYDPMYYEGVEWKFKLDVVRYAIADYTCEVAAYTELKKPSEGAKYTPAYHGSYVMDVEIPEEYRQDGIPSKREVRLILIEYIHGVTMSHLDPIRLSKRQRNNILIKAFIAEATVTHAGVWQHDFSPRNIIVIGKDFDSEDLQVKLVDFSMATVDRLTGFDEEPPKLLLNPITRYWGVMMDFAVDGWVGDDENEPERWLWKHFHKDTRFVPVERNKKDMWAVPKMMIDEC